MDVSAFFVSGMMKKKKEFNADEISKLRYLGIPEVSQYVRRSPGAVRNLVLRRAIPYHKPGGRLLFDREEIDRWVKGSEGISLEKINDEN